MGIQINGQTDTVTSTTAGGKVTVTPASFPSVDNLNATGIVTASSFRGALTGNVTGNVAGNVTGAINSTGVSTITTLSATSIVGVTTAGITTAYIGSVNDGPISGARNRIINGDMRIDQRYSGGSVTPTSDQTYTLDRWTARLTQASKYSVQQVTDAPTGFVNSIKCTSLSAYSVGASDHFGVSQYLEGLNTSDLSWGTSSASTVTLSFWVKSSLTGTFGGTVFAYQVGYPSYPFSYTISSANTWERKTITISGPTSGTFVTTNAGNIVIAWSLGTGSSLIGTANTWNYSTLYRSVSGEQSIVGTNGATFYITGVQLESGTVATPFERRSYGQELALCQRYLPAINATGNGYVDVGYIQSSNTMNTIYHFLVPTRTAPTGMTVSNIGSLGMTTQSAGGTWSSVTFNNSTVTSAQWTVTMTASSWSSQINYMAFWTVTGSGQILFTGCEL